MERGEGCEGGRGEGGKVEGGKGARVESWKQRCTLSPTPPLATLSNVPYWPIVEKEVFPVHETDRGTIAHPTGAKPEGIDRRVVADYDMF